MPRPALSVQYTGFAPTRELDAFMRFNEARGLDDFIGGLQWFDVGSQNFAYSDDRDNIAYFTSGEMPIREDPQAGTVNGVPPFFIRNGVSGNEWMPAQRPPAGSREPLRDPPVRGDAAHDQSARGVLREREQRSDRSDPRQRPAEPASSGWWYLLPEPRRRGPAPAVRRR